MGDLRALASRDDGEDEATGTGSGTIVSDNTNSTLARFFAEKGSTSLTAEERKRVAELLLGGTSAGATTAPTTRSTGYPSMPQTPGPAFTAGADVPTALTPSFSFTAPRFAARASAANTSVSPGSTASCLEHCGPDSYSTCTDPLTCLQTLFDHFIKPRRRDEWACPLWLQRRAERIAVPFWTLFARGSCFESQSCASVCGCQPALGCRPTCRLEASLSWSRILVAGCRASQACPSANERHL